MDTWHCKTLGDGVAAFAPSRRIQEMFLPIFAACGQPSDMAVFTRHDPEANQLTAYFSPRALKLATFFGAEPCEKPPSDGIGLLVGDSRCWGIFFPERKRRAA
ncbi:MAG TPA: hypothetical protein VEQ87_10120 [Burkholderiales bacterium]|nr:hypothetical protein [Burkholderiales bacterium]